jgi:hypothetical protein
VPDDPDEAGAAMMAAQDRLFLGQPVPTLDGRTPREAAGDPLLRPKLIRMLKNRVRAHDEQNLRTGRTDDINWMLRELGADEILFEPPPARAPVSLDSEPGEADSFLGGTSGPVDPTRPAAPRLPNRALTIEEASARLDEALAAFDKAADGLAELEASGSTLIPDVSELTDELLNDSELNCFVPLLLQAWFALVPPGSRAPHLEFEDLAETFGRALSALNDAADQAGPEALQRFLERGRQPAITQLLALQVFRLPKMMPARMGPRPGAQGVMLAMLKAVVDELDQALSN